MCLERYLGNGNFRNTELIAGISNQQRVVLLNRCRFWWSRAPVHQAISKTGSQSHLAARAHVIGNYSTKGSMLSDNSPGGVLVFLGFTTPIINFIAYQTRATARKITWCKDEGILVNVAVRANISPPHLTHGVIEPLGWHLCTCIHGLSLVLP